MLPHPEEVLIMADKYKLPELCNYYCSNQYPIGQQYVPEIKMKELPQIILETVASLNKMNKKQERLIEITADGIIDNDELDDCSIKTGVFLCKSVFSLIIIDIITIISMGFDTSITIVNIFKGFH